jgi:hypothetical protein
MKKLNSVEREIFLRSEWRGVRTKAYSSGCCLGFSLSLSPTLEIFYESLQFFSIIEIQLKLDVMEIVEVKSKWMFQW